MDDDDVTDENVSILEDTLPYNDPAEVVLTLDYLEIEIERCLKEMFSLSAVIDELEEKFSCKLSDVDYYHVEDKYINLLANCWLDEGFQFVSVSFDPRYPHALIEILNSVDSFSESYKCFGSSINYSYLISEQSKVLSSLQTREKELICELKKRCYSDILNKTGDTKNEMDFVKNFLEAAKSFKDINLFCELLQVNGILDCGDKINLKRLLSNLLHDDFYQFLTNGSELYSPKLRKLKNSAKRIYGNNEYFFIKDLRDIVVAYLKPVVIKESDADGRSLLEVSGKHIVISKELGEIEKILRFSHFEEVRFVGADVIHIDADLSRSVWHGKNIVVYGETLIVSEEKCVIWDVSGRDADFTAASEVAGTSEDGCGLKGEDGSPGESGGNVWIRVQSIENSMNFKIVSNGGNGSKGQNGGSGKDGKDGGYIDTKKFKEDFPPVSHILDKRKNYQKTIESVCQSLQSVDRLHYGLNEMDNITNIDFYLLVKQNEDLNNVYFKITTVEGFSIEFSFYNEGAFTFCQSFLLHKGALGTEGKVGGTGGCGGKGGLAGDVKVQVSTHINNFTPENGKNGADGKMGISGATGKPGKSGLDRGYMDRTLSVLQSVFSSVNWPIVFIPGPGDCNRLTVNYSSTKEPGRVWCPHNSSYAKLTQKRSTDHTEQSFQRIVVFEKHEHQETHVKRKKNVNQKSIVEQYKGKDSIWNTFNIEKVLKTIEEELEELTNDRSKETEKVTQKAKITRQISFWPNDWYVEEIKAVLNVEDTDSNQEKPNYKTLETTKNSVLQYDSPTSTVMSSPDALNTSTHSQKPSSNVSETQVVSLSKHHLDTLKNIYASVSLDHTLEQSVHIKSQITKTRFLDESNSVDSDASQDYSNLIEKFFCEDSIKCRQEVVKICRDCSLNEEPLQEALKCYVHEFENCVENETVSELAKHHSKAMQLKELKLKEKLLPLKNELSGKAKYKHLYNYLLDGVLKQSTESKLKFENEITKDKFLSYLYRSFVVEIKKSCDLEMEHFSPKVLLMFHKHLMDKGPFASSFREFLANHFDVNILLYSINENNKLVLVSSHNPKARSATHFLLKKNKFVKLNFDYEFARLFEKYEHLGNLLNKIMFQFCSFTDNKQITDYFSKSPFTSNGYSGLANSVVVAIKTNHILDQDKDVQTISNSYPSQKDGMLVKHRLEKLMTKFIGYENILHYMALHFEVEGNKTTARELCFVVNQILQISSEVPEAMSLVSWIIAAQPQQLWVIELALLKLELYFKRPLKQETKFKWKKYIEGQTEKPSLMVFLKKVDCETYHISFDSMEELLDLMGNVPNAHIGLESVNISEWKYYLKDRFWAHQMKSITNWSEEQLKTMSFYLVTWENSVGKPLCMNLVDILKKRAEEVTTEQDQDFMLTILKSLNNKEVCFSDKLWSLLSKTSVKEWMKVIDKESLNTFSERTLQQLIKLLKHSGNTSKDILEFLPDVEKSIESTNAVGTMLKTDLRENELKRLFLSIVNPNKNGSSLLFRIKSFLREITPDESTFDKALKVLLGIIKPSSQRLSENMMNAPLNILDRKQSTDQYSINLQDRNISLPLIELCIWLKHKKSLRNTQKLTVMILLTNAKNTLAQVSTGEGKSLIVVTVAIIKALRNEKVNIVTSSKVLAERDADNYKDIYELCGLRVGHNCSEDIEERKKVYSNCHIIYGDLANFQRDYLLDRVYNKNILGDSSFETVIVDEVDSMLLDKGNNVLYLSHNIPGLDKIEPVFFYIWKWVSRPISSKQFEDLFSIQAIKERIMYELFGVINKENLKQLDTSMTEKQVDRTWECLIEKEVINRNGKVLKESVNACNIDFPEDCIPKAHLKYILDKVINRERVLNIPKYLHLFVEDHLESWINSGVSAMVMESGRDYIVDVDRSETVTDRNAIITILDRDTGTDLVNSQWDEALHQFLQLKHGCKLSLLNLKAVFISNVSYLRRYKTLYGLTGTLGSIRDRELLQKVYGVDFVTIPTAKAKQLSEEPSVLCSSTEEWKQNIYDIVCKITKEKRSALIICETIKEVFILKEKLSTYFRRELIHTYTRDYERLCVADDLQPGKIIISTNLAGRGTDIKLSPQLIDNGGLYVCLTFLPSNYRVEEQAYGRAARNGQPGSAQLIFRTTAQSVSHTAAQVIDVKKQRDVYELKRLADIELYHETHIKQEEKWFDKFRKVYESLKEMEQKEDVKEILLQACLNKWAFWLDQNKKHLSTSNSHVICSSLENILSDWTKLGSGDLNDWLQLITDPTQLVNLGLACLKRKEFSDSLKCFAKVIREEPHFSETAHYYKVCVTTEQEDKACDSEDILEPLKFTAKKLRERADFLEISAIEVNWLKKQDKKNVIQVDYLLDQQTNKSKIYEIILQSIYSIIGKAMYPEDFIIPGLIEQHVAKGVFNGLLKNCVLTNPKIKSNIEINELMFVKNYGLSPNKMKRFISEFEGEDYEAQQFLKSFESECVIPSREAFWKELVNNEALVNEESYVFIDMQELLLFHPSLCQRIETKLGRKWPVSKVNISLFQPEELVNMKDSKALSFIKQSELIQLIGSNMYRLLEKKSMLNLNKSATFHLKKHLIFDNFDRLNIEDFQTVNICEEIASKIIEDLTNQHIIKVESSRNPVWYSLLCEAENVEHIELTTHKAYTYEVRSLLSVCFAFRIAYEKLKLLNRNACENICLPLPVKLHERIVLDLKENQIIGESFVKKEKDVSKELDALYPKSMSRDGFKELLSEVCCDMSCDSVLDMLIEKKWLIMETGFCKPNNVTYYINSHIKSLLYPERNPQHSTKTKDNPKPKPLLIHSEGNTIMTTGLSLFDNPKPEPEPLPIPSEGNTIMTTVLNRLYLVENLSYVKSVVSGSRGQYLLVETPNFSLTPLLDILLEKQLSSEIEVFALNGFDQLIVLEEKKWTKSTFRNIRYIVTAGICQIAVGVFLQACFVANPFEINLILEGVCDLVYAIGCCFTGHCHLQTYLLSKLVSVAMTLSPSIWNLFKSGFGKQVSGLSFKSIKEALSKGFKQVSQRSILKETSIKVVTVVSQGLFYASIDHFIEPQLDKISLVITEAIHSKINETIDNHSINSSIREACSLYGPAGSKITISACFSKHMNSSKDKFDNSFSSTVTTIHTLVRQICSQCKKTTQKTTANTVVDIPQILEICNNVVKAIVGCQNLYNGLVANIKDVLDVIEEDLERIILQEKTNILSRKAVSTSEEELNSFTLSVCNDWKSEIKNQISDSLKTNLLSPALQYLANHLVQSSSKFLLRKSKAISRIDEIHKQNVADYKHTQPKKKVKTNGQICDDSDYEESLLKLLRKKRSVAIFTEILRKNATIDTNFLEMCCFILPKALKNEGVELLNLEILVERNGTCQRFSTTDEKCQKTTIIIAPDSDIATNVLKNNALIKCGVDFLLTKVSQHYPDLSGYPIECLRSYVAEQILNVFGEQPYLPITDYNLSCAINCFKINALVEHKVPYQHFHVGGKYVFNMKADVDVRTEEKLSSLALIEDHVFDGFVCALNKINDHIHKVQDHLRNFSLSFEDFEKTNFDICPQTNKGIKGNFHCFPTHYKLVIPFVSQINERRIENFTITMSLNNHVRKKEPFSPYGPHIAYEISSNLHFDYLNKGTKGYVLINEQCSECNFSAENCHVAGELIFPTGFQFQKPCKVLMLGDSMFDAAREIASHPNFVAVSYSTLDDLKSCIADVTMFYTGIQGVVLIPGITTSKAKMSGGEITTTIAGAIEEIQCQFKKVKVVVCSLFKAKSLSVGKLTQTNKCLKMHCSKINVHFLEINGFISSDELEKDGIHLNKRGLTKIQQYVLKQ